MLDRIAMIDDVRYGGDTPAEQGEKVAPFAFGAQCPPHRNDRRRPPRRPHLIQRSNPDAIAGRSQRAPTNDFRLVKSPAEMVFVDIASRMNDAAIEALATELRPGVNEYEVARIIEDVYNCRSGMESHPLLIEHTDGRPRGLRPPPVPSRPALQAGDVFVTEISTTFWGYAGQILRTFHYRLRPDAPLPAPARRGHRGV